MCPICNGGGFRDGKYCLACNGSGNYTRPRLGPIRKRLSSLVSDYLDAAMRHAWTPGTFLHYTLKGKASKYMGRYADALKRSLVDLENIGAVIKIRSARGGVAYIRKEN